MNIEIIIAVFVVLIPVLLLARRGKRGPNDGASSQGGGDGVVDTGAGDSCGDSGGGDGGGGCD